MKKIFLPFLFLFVFLHAHAQVGIGTTTPNPRAALDIVDSTKGLLIPRMTMVKRLAIPAPPQSLLVYQTDSTKGYWYYEGTAWRNINASSNHGGKHTIILSDSITNNQAVTKIAAEFGPNTQELRIQGCLYLTTVNLSMFTTASNITITDNHLLTSVNLQNLKTCDGYFSLNLCPSLTSLNVNSLEKILYNSANQIYALYINNTGIVNLNFPVLKRVLGSTFIGNNVPLKTVSFPLLSAELSYLRVDKNVSLLSISYPLLTSIGLIQMFTNTSLTSLSFPSLTRFTFNDPYTPTFIQDCYSLTSIVLGNLTQFRNGSFENSGTKLSSESVNALLHNFVGITPPLNGKTIRLMQIPAAPPTGQGIIDKATLIAQGNTVYTN